MTARGAVLVTGASSGIGAVTAQTLAAAGFRVWAGLRSDADASRIAAPAITPVQLDVTNAAHIAAAMERIEAAGGLYGLVNNAGIVVAGPLESLPLDDLRHQFEVNTIAPLALTQAALPMLRRSVGRIVTIGSISSRAPFPFTGPYGASKAAIRLISDGLRMELAPWGIGVTLIEPGAIRTPIWDRSVQDGEARFDRMPPLTQERYGERFRAMRGVAALAQARGSAAERVASAVRNALLATTAPPLVTVGIDARVQNVLAVLPAGVRDGLIARVMGRAAS